MPLNPSYPIVVRLVAPQEEGTVGAGITLDQQLSTAEWHLEKRATPQVVTTVDGTEHVYERITSGTTIAQAFRHTLELTFKPLTGEDIYDLINYLAKSTWFNVHILDDYFVRWYNPSTYFTARVTTNIDARELFKSPTELKRYYGGMTMTLRER
jgi:hypothetical protein